jgi:hypothetical protein
MCLLFGYLATLFSVHYLYRVECDTDIIMMRYISGVFEYFTPYCTRTGSGQSPYGQCQDTRSGRLAGIRSAASSVQIESYTNLPFCVMSFNEVLREAFKICPLSEQGINIFQYSSFNCNIKSNLIRF